MQIRILIIDDHPLIIEGLKTILLQNIKEDIEISTSYSLAEAYCLIFEKKRDELFEIVILDVSMPAFKDKNIINGIELGKLIRENFPTIKLIMLTMHSEPLILFNIFEMLNPEALLVKSDINHKQFILAFRSVIHGKQFYSETPQAAIKKVSLQNFCKDELNRQILVSISQRYTSKEMANMFKVSESTVEKRKAIIRDYLNIKNAKDGDLVAASKKIGLL